MDPKGMARRKRGGADTLPMATTGGLSARELSTMSSRRQGATEFTKLSHQGGEA